MNALRAFFLLCCLALPTALDAQAEASKPLYLPFTVDAGYRLITDTRGHYRHQARTLFMLDVNMLSGGMPTPHQLVTDLAFEIGAGYDRNPTRLRLVGGYGYCADSSGTGSYYRDRADVRESFPLYRTAMLTWGLAVAAGCEREWLADGQSAPAEEHDGLRVQHWAFVGLLFIEFRVEAAVVFQVDEGWRAVPEVGAEIRLGRPISPVTLSAGWLWIGRGSGEHLVTLGITIAL